MALADAGLTLADVDGYFCAGDAPGLGGMSMADMVRDRVESGAYGRLLETFTRRMWGKVPDNLYVAVHHRPVMNAVFGFERKVAKFDALDAHLKTYGVKNDEIFARIAAELADLAVQTAERVGVVAVDVGDTSCKVPFAPDYIAKVRKRGGVDFLERQR